MAKALADDHRTVLVDLPHHGRSPWSESFDYVEVADQVAELLADLFGRTTRSRWSATRWAARRRW